MAAAPFVVGLFHATPSDLSLLAGLRRPARPCHCRRCARPFALWQTAFELVRFVVFGSAGIWAFRLLAGSPSLPVWHSALAAILAATSDHRSASRVHLGRRAACSARVIGTPGSLLGYHLAARHSSPRSRRCASGSSPSGSSPSTVRRSFQHLTVVTIAVLMTHRAWVRERYDHEAAEFLIGAVDALAGRELEPSIVLLLNRARAIFHAEIAQLTVFPSQPNEKAFPHHRAQRPFPDEVMVPLGLGELDDVLEARDRAGVIVRVGAADDPSAQMLERGAAFARRWSALLRGESRMIGSLMVGGHLDARDVRPA